MDKSKIKDLIKNNSVWEYLLLFAVVTVTVFLLSYLSPRTCDDVTYAFSTQSSLADLLKSSLMQGNGRLFGNFFGYLVSKRVFTVVERTFIWTGIIFLVVKLSGVKNIFVNTVVAAVLIYPADSLFSQVYAWNAGFQNYAFPVFIILFDLYLLRLCSESKNGKVRIFLTFIVILSSFCGQFFSENSSIFAVMLSAFLLVSAFLKKTKKAGYVCYLVSTLSCFAVMMTYPEILGTAEKISSYRGIAGNLGEIINQASENYDIISKNFIEYAFAWIILSSAFLLMINTLFESAKTPFFRILLSASRVILIFYPILSIFYSLIFKSAITFPREYLRIILNWSLFLYFAVIFTLCVVVFLKKDSAENSKHSAAVFVLGLASVLPLLVVTPIGGRTFYIPFICFLLSGLMGCKDGIPDKLKTKQSALVAFAVLFCCSIMLVCAQKDNNYAYNVRLNYIEKQLENGETQLILPELPHSNLVHDDTNSGTWNFFFNKKSETPVYYEFRSWNSWYTEYRKG